MCGTLAFLARKKSLNGLLLVSELTFKIYVCPMPFAILHALQPTKWTNTWRVRGPSSRKYWFAPASGYKVKHIQRNFTDCKVRVKDISTRRLHQKTLSSAFIVLQSIFTVQAYNFYHKKRQWIPLYPKKEQFLTRVFSIIHIPLYPLQGHLKFSEKSWTIRRKQPEIVTNRI